MFEDLKNVLRDWARRHILGLLGLITVIILLITWTFAGWIAYWTSNKSNGTNGAVSSNNSSANNTNTGGTIPPTESWQVATAEDSEGPIVHLGNNLLDGDDIPTWTKWSTAEEKAYRVDFCGTEKGLVYQDSRVFFLDKEVKEATVSYTKDGVTKERKLEIGKRDEYWLIKPYAAVNIHGSASYTIKYKEAGKVQVCYLTLVKPA